MELSPDKVGHIIIRAREDETKVAAFDTDTSPPNTGNEPETILEDRRDDATRQELAAFIAALNVDEKAELVALTWVGRGTFTPDDWHEAVRTARDEQDVSTEDYLLGIPLLADYLEEGLEALGIPVADVESGAL